MHPQFNTTTIAGPRFENDQSGRNQVPQQISSRPIPTLRTLRGCPILLRVLHIVEVRRKHAPQRSVRCASTSACRCFPIYKLFDAPADGRRRGGQAKPGQRLLG